MTATACALLVTLAASSAPQQGARRVVAPPPDTTSLQRPGRCVETVKDLASDACVSVSSTPVLGSLYPLGPELNVDPAGNVGIGTTNPSSKLEVAGMAKINGTLTLAPSDDLALDLATGSVYKGGTLFVHTKGTDSTAVGSAALSNTTAGAANNTAVGSGALADSVNGWNNTAIGKDALKYNQGEGTAFGFGNTAVGHHAGRMNTRGSINTAIGSEALLSDSVGFGNTAVGASALRESVDDSYNTACGSFSLLRMEGSGNTGIGCLSLSSGATGNNNIAVGFRAGAFLAGDDNIAIGNAGVSTDDGTIRIGTTGTHTRTFVAGVRSTTTGVANAVPVMIDALGQLGTVSSSRSRKEDIRDMGAGTDRLLQLRPVTFRYKERAAGMGESAPVEFGLVAEEVADVFPELVVRDEAGRPETVKYHLLSSMLLNELMKLHERSEARHRSNEARYRSTARELAELRARLAEIERQPSSATTATSKGKNQ